MTLEKKGTLFWEDHFSGAATKKKVGKRGATELLSLVLAVVQSVPGSSPPVSMKKLRVRQQSFQNALQLPTRGLPSELSQGKPARLGH